MTPRPPGSAPAIHVESVSKSFGPTAAVRGVSFAAERGQVLALLGPNGAGKTTTTEMCEGFLRPDSGEVRVLGLDPVADSARLRPRIGVMLQGGGAYPGAQAGEMLSLVAAYSADPLDPGWLLTTLGLDQVRRTPYRRLSGGQQQRLALACALVNRPELVFLDEPTAGMDAHARLLVWELISALRADGVSVLLTTHQLAEAEQLADWLLIMDHGQIVASGTPADLTSASGQGQLRFSAPPRLDLNLLQAALPEGFSAQEHSPGSYLVGGGDISPQVMAAVTAWCAQIDVLATDMRVDQRRLEEVFLELTGRETRP